MRPSKAKLVNWLLGAYRIGPIVVTLMDVAICQVLGFQPNEGGTKQYFVLGFDLGGLLNLFYMTALFSVFTMPTGMLALVFSKGL
jgi:hypothetical protein